MHTHIHQTRLKSLKKVISQEADGACFLVYKTSSDGGIHPKRDHNIISELRNTKKCVGPFTTKVVEC
jgi:hypothetical protein